MTTAPREISVVAPISPAIDQVKRVLFQPFDLGKWFVIGFCAWLAFLGQGGGGGGGGNNFDQGNAGNIRDSVEHARDYVAQNLHWIVPLVIGVIVVGLGIWVLLTWLSSRGRFMFLHCVALNRAEVVNPWHRYVRPANSLCLFRLGLGLAGMVAMLPLIAVGVVMGYGMVQRGGPGVGGVLGLIGLVLVVILVGVCFAAVAKFTEDFVVPIQYLRGCGCWAAWKEFGGLLSGNPGRFILYLLFSLVLSLAIGAIVFFVMIVTCCIACCLLMIPYLGTVLMLPVLVFQRSFSLFYLAQYGPEYDVFAASEAPPATIS